MSAAIVSLPLVLAVSFVPGPRDTPGTVEPGADLYPPAALAAKLEGDVPVHLQIGADGSMRCTSPITGRLAPLKRASCELVAHRDIFPPRIGRDGIAIATTLDLTIRWRLAADGAQFGGAVPIDRTYWVRHVDYPYVGGFNYSGGRVRVAFDIGTTGRVEGCKVEKTSANLTLSGLVCPLLVKRAMLLPALDDSGVPRRTRGWFVILWRNTPLSEDFSEEEPREGAIPLE